MFGKLCFQCSSLKYNRVLARHLYLLDFIVGLQYFFQPEPLKYIVCVPEITNKQAFKVIWSILFWISEINLLEELSMNIY